MTGVERRVGGRRESRAPWGNPVGCGVSEALLDAPSRVVEDLGIDPGERYSWEVEFAPWAKQLQCPGWFLLQQQKCRRKGPCK